MTDCIFSNLCAYSLGCAGHEEDCPCQTCGLLKDNIDACDNCKKLDSWYKGLGTEEDLPVLQQYCPR